MNVFFIYLEKITRTTPRTTTNMHYKSHPQWEKTLSNLVPTADECRVQNKNTQSVPGLLATIVTVITLQQLFCMLGMYYLMCLVSSNLEKKQVQGKCMDEVKED